ncbi:MAG: xanthine dehydrogenase family protein subunit M [Rhizobiales bacterium]|nr:xanthine dehydrogenase family protein subunit M [Hyphomicrobiales bacterium]OJY43700.1 MAG: hypothetical protein BGP08_09220 [Rhizobiales bacterium 64-17]
MKPPRFDYLRPQTLAEAVELLDRHGGDAAILAGGQSLMPMLNLRVAQPAVLIDINAVPELDRIGRSGDRLSIGGRARHNDVFRSAEVAQAAPLLTVALEHVAHEAIRNRGTLGGSLALADPAAELPACMVCLDAEIVTASVKGERRIPAGAFFQGLYTTTLEPNEILARVDVPAAGTDWRFGFDEVARRRGDFAMAGVAVAVREESKAVAECRISLLGVEMSPRRMEAVEMCLLDAPLGTAANIVAAQSALRDTLEPIEGSEIPPEYRIQIAHELLARVIRAMAAPVSGKRTH